MITIITSEPRGGVKVADTSEAGDGLSRGPDVGAQGLGSHVNEGTRLEGRPCAQRVTQSLRTVLDQFNRMAEALNVQLVK